MTPADAEDRLQLFLLLLLFVSSWVSSCRRCWLSVVKASSRQSTLSAARYLLLPPADAVLRDEVTSSRWRTRSTLPSDATRSTAHCSAVFWYTKSYTHVRYTPRRRWSKK